MAKDPAFIFYPGDYLRDTQTLSEKSQVAYDRIMCEHMRNICISQQQLKFFTKKLNDEEIAELMFTLTETADGFQIEWVAESIEKRRKYSQSRSENRKSKKKKEKKDMLTYDEHMENEIEDVNVNKDKIKNKVPEFFEFFEHAKTIEIYSPQMDFQIQAKYEAWKANGWKDGNGQKIKNWKTKLANTMPYFKTGPPKKNINSSLSRITRDRTNQINDL